MPLQHISVKNYGVVEACSTSRMPASSSSSSSNASQSGSDICRICHCEADPTNPLLSPCYCAGSLKYVHQSCLQQWLTASESRSCELCKFNFILHTKIKPINEWRKLEMSSVERRRLLCAILFHFVAGMCVVWSLFVLIDRAAEEVQKGQIAWPFWTKLVVVAVGFTGGAVFMYIQCRQYLHLCARWKAHNRIILVQNAPENMVRSSSPARQPASKVRPSLHQQQHLQQHLQQQQQHLQHGRVLASVEHETCYSSGGGGQPAAAFGHVHHIHHVLDNSQLRVEAAEADLAVDEKPPLKSPSLDALELNIQEVLALDVERRRSHALNAPPGMVRCAKNSVVSLEGGDRRLKEPAVDRSKLFFKSLPNLNASSEKLLP